MLTVLTLLKLKPSPNGAQHGERQFWREMGSVYLEAWLAGVAKHVPKPHRVRVMTDSPEIVPRGVSTVALDTDVDAPGWWAKLNMFREGVSEGVTLYADLDTAFCGDLSPLCALTPDPLLMLDDRNVPGLPNGSVMLFDAERCHSIWDAYAVDPRRLEREYVVRGNDYSRAFDQAFVADWVRITTGGDPTFFQEQLPLGFCLNSYSELPHADDWRETRLIFGCGGSKEGKMHTATHQVFRENWAAI